MPVLHEQAFLFSQSFEICQIIKPAHLRRLYFVTPYLLFINEIYDEPGACGAFCGGYGDVWTDDDSVP